MNKKVIGIIVMVLVIGGAVAVRAAAAAGKKSNSAAAKPQPPNIIARTDIGKNFIFKFGSAPQKEIAYTLESASLEDEIIVNGQRVRPVAGKTFLVVSLKIKNDTTQGIQMSTRDYIRLKTPGTENEWSAPDIHSDPVEIQAISTKYTRLGFPVPESERQFVVRVGEINGEKTELPISFK